MKPACNNECQRGTRQGRPALPGTDKLQNPSRDLEAAKSQIAAKTRHRAMHRNRTLRRPQQRKQVPRLLQKWSLLLSLFQLQGVLL